MIAESPKSRALLQQALYELQVHQIELQLQNSELRAREHELDISQARYFELYDLAPIGYLTIDAHGHILEANLTIVTMVGVARSLLVASRIYSYISIEDRDVFFLYCKQLLNSGKTQTCELRLLKTAGDFFWAKVDGIAVQDMVSGKTSYRIIVSDIHDRKLLDYTATKALEKARAANITMNRLLRTIAHEFRTPLGLLSAGTDVLDCYWDQLTPDKRFKQNERIRDAVQQLTTLVNSVTSYNTLGEDSLGNYPQPHNITYLCSAIAAGVESVWSRGQRWKVNIADNCGTALVDEGLLRRVIENLLTNAFRYTAEDGEVAFSAHRENSHLCLEIRDSGIGIPHEDLPHIFEPFYRSRNIITRRGLGLGLAIVHEALEEMGGSISVISTVGSGTVMSAQIPAVIPQKTNNPTKKHLKHRATEQLSKNKE